MNTIDYSRYEFLLIERRGPILEVALNRPERYNAISHELHEELGQIFLDIARDPETIVAILTGTGKAFAAGGDLREMHAHAQQVGEGGHYIDMHTAKRIVFSMLDLEKPIIAKINGPAMGLGATIALLCDLTYMADTASIGDPHVTAGVVAGDGGAVIWPQLIGYARAKEYLMTGDAISAAKAADMGLVNHVIPAAELDDAVDAMAQRLADGPREAIRWTKTTINIGLRQLAHSIMDASLGYETVTMRSATHAEAITAFAEKRQPNFRGL